MKFLILDDVLCQIQKKVAVNTYEIYEFRIFFLIKS